MKFLHVSGLITMGVCLCVAAPGAAYRSPLSVAVSPDGKTLYVSDKTAGCVTSLDAATFSTNSAASGDPLAFASSSELIPS